MVELSVNQLEPGIAIVLPGSKSIANRLLILKQFHPQLAITNLPDSDDVRAMEMALNDSRNSINVGHAGTTMRFLTAYFACNGKHLTILSGSNRMKKRPIGPLVTALIKMGAEIQYVDSEGFPPIQIMPRNIKAQSVTVEANLSSQFTTAILLNANCFPKPFVLNRIGQVVSDSYTDMTIKLMKLLGYEIERNSSEIVVAASPDYVNQTIAVEADWSAASYFYSLVALSPIGFHLTLNGLSRNSVQGDAAVSDIFETFFGVNTSYRQDRIEISKVREAERRIVVDLINQPDLAQTLAVTAACLGCDCNLTGLQTLVDKETNRLVALKSELQKFGVNVLITGESLSFENSELKSPIAAIETYDDHRMAMAFAPVAMFFPVKISVPEVVSKSFPNFWRELQKTGVNVRNCSS